MKKIISLAIFVILFSNVAFAQWKYEDGRAKISKQKSDVEMAVMAVSGNKNSPLLNFQTLGAPSAKTIKLTVDGNRYVINDFYARRSKDEGLLTIEVYTVYVKHEIIELLKNGKKVDVKFDTGRDWGNTTYTFTLEGSYKAITKALH